MKENVKKKLARSSLTWAGHAERMRDKKTGKVSRFSESEREKRGKRTEIAMGNCLKEIQKEKEKNGENVQQIEGIGVC